MSTQAPVIEIKDLHRSYGKVDAVKGLNLTVQPGRCYGFLGRNGAGKTSTIHCLLNLLRPERGSVKLFGQCPRRDEVAVKTRLAWVPDTASFYPWMRIRSHFHFLASVRQKWNRELESQLLERFELAWKTVKDFLEEGGLAFVTITPRQVLKDAFAAKILNDGQLWIDMLDHRNLLAHTYNLARFEKAVDAIHTRYLHAFAQLHERLQQEMSQ